MWVSTRSRCAWRSPHCSLPDSPRADSRSITFTHLPRRRDRRQHSGRVAEVAECADEASWGERCETTTRERRVQGSGRCDDARIRDGQPCAKRRARRQARRRRLFRARAGVVSAAAVARGASRGDPRTACRVGHSATAQEPVVAVPGKDARDAEPRGHGDDEEEEESRLGERAREEADGAVGCAAGTVGRVVRVAGDKVVDEEGKGRGGHALQNARERSGQARAGVRYENVEAHGKEVQAEEGTVAENRHDCRGHKAVGSLRQSVIEERRAVKVERRAQSATH